MRRPLRRALRITLVVLAVVVGLPVAVVVLSEIFGWNWARPVVEWAIERSTGRETEIAGDLDVDLGRVPRVAVARVSFANAPWGSDPSMLVGDAVAVRFRLWPLLRGRLRIEELDLAGVRLLLEVGERRIGNWTFEGGGEKLPAGAPGSGELPLPARLVARDVRIGYVDRANDRVVEFDVARLRAAARRNGAIGFEATGRYRREPLAVEGVLGPIETFWAGEPYPLAARARFGATRARVEGVVRKPRELDGVDLALDLRGESLADLWQLAGLPLAETPEYGVVGRLRKQGDTWGIYDFDGRIGRSDLHGDLAVTLRAERAPLLRAELRSRSMDIDDFEGFWGRRVAEEESRPAPASAGAPLFSDRPFDFSKLGAMDAIVDFRAASVKSPSVLDDVVLRFGLERGRLRWDPLALGFAGGRIESRATLDASGREASLGGDLVFRGIELAKVLESAGLDYKGHGKIGGRAHVATHGNSLRAMATHADGEIGGLLQQAELSDTLIELAALDLGEFVMRKLEGEEQVPIRCLVANFEVENGRMEARTMLMDTGVDRLVGEGTIDLAREELDLELYEHPRRFTLGSLASPILIEGSFQNRKARLDRSGMLKRGGAALVLGVLVHPAAALLPLVELGEEKESGACRQALAEYRSIASRADAEQTAARDAAREGRPIPDSD